MFFVELVDVRGDVVDSHALVVTLRPLRRSSVATLELAVIVFGEASQDLHHHRTHLEAAFGEDRADDLLAEDALPGLRQIASPNCDGVLVLLLVPGATLLPDSAEFLPKFIEAGRDILRLPRVLRDAGAWLTLVRPAPRDRPLGNWNTLWQLPRA